MRQASTWVLLAFLAIAAFFLLTEHRAHVWGVAPYLLLLACPLLHLFMHRGHGRHRASSRDGAGHVGDRQGAGRHEETAAAGVRGPASWVSRSRNPYATGSIRAWLERRRARIPRPARDLRQ